MGSRERHSSSARTTTRCATRGCYDGPLGVLCAIEVVEAVGDAGGPIEVVAFSDEEGTRYAVAYLGSSAYRGRFEAAWLELEDADGIAMAAALDTRRR